MDWIKGWTTGSYMLLTVVLTILLSAITYRCIESPAIRLGSLLSKRTASKYRKKLQD
jgi:peptidoglycan/LPS O-acetylase OafA/YrhL